MNTTQARDLVEHRASSNGLGLFRQHFSRLLHICGGAPVGFPVQDAVVGVSRMAGSAETVGHMDHEQRPLRRLADPGRGDVHAVFQAPGLFGISKVQLPWEPQPVIVDEGRVGQVHVTAEQHDISAGVGGQVGRGEDDAMQRLWARFVAQLRLGDPGLDGPLHRGLCEVWHGEVVVIHLGAIRAMGTSPGLGPRIGAGPRRRIPQRGQQLELALPGHLQGVGGAAGAVEPHRGQRDHADDPGQQGVAPAGNPPSLRHEGPGSFGLVRAALGPPRPPLGPRSLGLLGRRLGLAGGLLRVAAHDLLDAQWQRPPGRATHERQREDGHPGDGLAVQARKEPIQARRARAGCGDAAVSARDEVDVIGTGQRVPEDAPTQAPPREDRGEQAWERALTAACARPARPAAPGETSGPHQARRHAPAAAA